MKEKARKNYLLVSGILMLVIAIGIILSAFLPIVTVSAERIMSANYYSDGKYTSDITPEKIGISLPNLFKFFKYEEYISHIISIHEKERQIKVAEEQIQKDQAEYAQKLLELEYPSESKLNNLREKYDRLRAEQEEIIKDFENEINTQILDFGYKNEELEKLLEESEFLDALFFSYAFSDMYNNNNSAINNLIEYIYESRENGIIYTLMSFIFALLASMGTGIPGACLLSFFVATISCFVFAVISFTHYLKNSQNSHTATIKWIPPFAPIAMAMYLGYVMLSSVNSILSSIEIGAGPIVLTVLVVAAYLIKGLVHLVFDTAFKVRNVVNVVLVFVCIIFIAIVLFNFSDIRFTSHVFERSSDFVSRQYSIVLLERLDAGDAIDIASETAKVASVDALEKLIPLAGIFDGAAILFICIFFATFITLLGSAVTAPFKQLYSKKTTCITEPSYENNNLISRNVILYAILILVISLLPSMLFSVSTLDECVELETQGIIKIHFDDHKEEGTSAHTEYENLLQSTEERKEEIAEISAMLSKVDDEKEKQTLIKEKEETEKQLAILEHKLAYVSTSETNASNTMITFSALTLFISIVIAISCKRFDVWFPKSLIHATKEEIEQETNDVQKENLFSES